MSKRVYITSLHGQKSAKKFDWETCIADGTHVLIHFTIYNDENDTGQGWTAYEIIISNEELFAMLKDRCEVHVQEPMHLRMSFSTDGKRTS